MVAQLQGLTAGTEIGDLAVSRLGQSVADPQDQNAATVCVRIAATAATREPLFHLQRSSNAPGLSSVPGYMGGDSTGPKRSSNTGRACSPKLRCIIESSSATATSRASSLQRRPSSSPASPSTRNPVPTSRERPSEYRWGASPSRAAVTRAAIATSGSGPIIRRLGRGCDHF
ncbi:hypothetical protein [Nocardia miyunensis]|uniref:hypothetical protein n=1 Tax=Nocardia miyunensis TaxID=282684 RepID=UPI003F776570